MSEPSETCFSWQWALRKASAQAHVAGLCSAGVLESLAALHDDDDGEGGDDNHDDYDYNYDGDDGGDADADGEAEMRPTTRPAPCQHNRDRE